ncbi:hypothetical protein ACHABQ_10800 [Nesterenkonia aurantiaca]
MRTVVIEIAVLGAIEAWAAADFWTRGGRGETRPQDGELFHHKLQQTW